MNRIAVVLQLMVTVAFLTLTGCSSGSNDANVRLSAANLNLVFVVSPDVAYQSAGDVNPATANLTSQGLQRSLRMATFLKQQVLGGSNVGGIYALEPMTHLQTANNYPDMTAIGYIQQFALLNRKALPVTPFSSYTANSYPIGVSYAPGSVPSGVAAPFTNNSGCRGLAFNDTVGNNIALVSGIIDAHAPGFHVFSAPWETVSALLADIDNRYGYHLELPTTYRGSNHIYALSITPSGAASLATIDSKLNPSASYPVLPLSLATTSAAIQTPFSTSRIGGVNGAAVPAGINTSQTIYIVRHAEAHPDATTRFENGNYVAAGQWRALDLPNILHGKINPSVVYSIDPAQSFSLFHSNTSYVRPSLTVLPYVIANNLPYYLVHDFQLGHPDVARFTSDFFFTGGTFSGKTVLLAWESGRIIPFINWLLNSYGGTGTLPSTAWPSTDYNTIWTVTLDAGGNVKVNNLLTEGIDSAALPATAPLF